jgi:aerobic carbon-monoxide dehydrogenase large subunit
MATTSRRSSWIGRSVPRKEDERLITGKGNFSDDVHWPGQTYAVFVRSPHAHARILNIDVQRAFKISGVLTVLTGRDLRADGLKPLPHEPAETRHSDLQVGNRDGVESFVSRQYPLTPDKVRCIGEPVVVVIAESVAAAKDGAEVVEVDYETLPAVSVTSKAMLPAAPRVWDELNSNIVIDIEVGSLPPTAAAFAKADHVARLDTGIVPGLGR